MDHSGFFMDRPSQHKAFHIADTFIDPEYEPMEDVLGRLGEFAANDDSEPSLAYTKCDCEANRKRSIVEEGDSSDGEDNSDDDDDDDPGIQLSILLKTFQQFEEKDYSKNRQKAMMRLVENFVCERAVTEESFDEIVQFMKTSKAEVQEACLVLLRTCVKHSDNILRLLHLDCNLLEMLYQYLLPPNLPPVKKSALLLLEQILLCSAHKDLWMEFCVDKLLPKLISMLRGEQNPLDVEYAACCMLRALARYEEFLGPITEHVLPTVKNRRHKSARFKEVYVEILTCVLGQDHNIPIELIDSSAIPVAMNIVVEGPCGSQGSALQLLACLSSKDGMVATMINTNGIVPMLLCCLKESKCRKVRWQAGEAMKNLCSCRRFGLCKDLMLQMTGYFAPLPDSDSLTTLYHATNSRGGNRPKPSIDRQLWAGLEHFLDLEQQVIFKEGRVETDDLDLVQSVDFEPSANISSIQLELLVNSFKTLKHICTWPIDKSGSGAHGQKLDLTSLVDDAKQRAYLSKINRGLTLAVWDKVGVVITKILSKYAAKISSSCQSTKSTSICPRLEILFSNQETVLITVLLELMLCFAVGTCESFTKITSEKETSKDKRQGKISQNGKSSTSPHQENCSICGSQQRSPPYICCATRNSSTGVQSSDLDKVKSELSLKEASTDRRLLRKCLFEAGVFQCISPFIQCTELEIQILVLQILRSMVQPVKERALPKEYMVNRGNKSGDARARPQTACSVRDVNKRLNTALTQMSPEMSKLITHALEPHLRLVAESQEPAQEHPKAKDISDIQERLQEFSEKKDLKSKPKLPDEGKKQRTILDPCRPVAEQCREALLTHMHSQVIMGIFSRMVSIRRYYVFLLHDLVLLGQRDIHMTLSSYGCMPKLVDFLRVNEDNELLEIVGLTIVRMMISSDIRLKQLFNRHGGSQLLLSMAQYTTGTLKQHVSTTLRAISKAPPPTRRRPASAPVTRQTIPQRAPDIWDHIQSRWNKEDQVKNVLRQWIDTDIDKLRKK